MNLVIENLRKPDIAVPPNCPNADLVKQIIVLNRAGWFMTNSTANSSPSLSEHPTLIKPPRS